MMTPVKLKITLKRCTDMPITSYLFPAMRLNELSREILYTAIRELPKLRDDSRFEPWLWGVAANVTKSFRRTMGKYRAVYSFDVPEDIPFYDSDDYESEKIFDALRAKIAMLSEIYRNVIILYYYDGLSTREISDKLNIPEGTITWRLSEGRKKLKKELNDMNETALRPICMSIGIYGSGDYDGKRIPFSPMFTLRRTIAEYPLLFL